MLLVLYGLYIFILTQNVRLESWAKSTFHSVEERRKLIPPDIVRSHEKIDNAVPLTANAGKESTMGRLVTWASLPIQLLMKATVLDCRRPKLHRFYLVTFVMSLVWIVLFSYVMVWMIIVVGFTLGIPDTVMGLTFMAAGVSVPDALASLAVTKDGKSTSAG